MHTCPHCAAPAPHLLRVGDLNQKVGTQEFDYYRCSTCRLVFVAPIPPNLGAYYANAYPAYAIPDSTEALERARAAVQWRVDFVQQHASRTGRLLEIGPSYGGFAYAAHRAGFQVVAVEMDAACCAFINRTIPGAVAIHTDDVAGAVAKLDGLYDVIALWHNLEHLPDPWAVMRGLADKLAPNGHIVIATPNPESWQFRLFGKHWVHLDAPRHLMLIPEPIVDRVLGEQGLKRVMRTTTDPDGRLMTASGWSTSIGHRLNAAPSFRHLRKRWLKLVRFFLRPFERLLDNGAAYTVVYRKPAENP